MTARWTRASMAHQLTRMWTAPRPPLRARLPARMWWQPSNRSRLDLLLTPAGIVVGWVDLWQIAARTSPLPRRWQLPIHYGSLLMCRDLILRPSLHTGQVQNRPAGSAAPDLGIWQHFVGTDDTFVQPVCDILVGSCGDIWGLRLGHSTLGGVSGLLLSSPRDDRSTRDEFGGIASQRILAGCCRRQLPSKCSLPVDQ